MFPAEHARGQEGQVKTFPELTGNSFTISGQKYALGYPLASSIMRWDHRVNEGVLQETDTGFILDEDYAGCAFDRLHQGTNQD